MPGPEKQAPISEVLLVLDATTGQNGVMQAEAFLEHAGAPAPQRRRAA
jgi:fused signal recognition particle receptor